MCKGLKVRIFFFDKRILNLLNQLFSFYVFLEMKNESEGEIFKVFLRDIVMTYSERMTFDVIRRHFTAVSVWMGEDLSFQEKKS